MFGSDLEIDAENGQYLIKYLDKKIKCTDSEDLLAHKNFELLSFICEDLDRCGEIKISKENILKIDSGIPCAYYIFSAQKLSIENKKNFKELSDFLLSFPIHDFSLIQVANGGPLEMEEMGRLMPIRNAILNQIGEENFKKLTSFCWGTYYFSMNMPPRKPTKKDEGKNFGPGIFKSDESFAKTDLAKTIFKLFNEASNEEKACILSLFHSVETRSILLPICFIRKWITKREFISAAMGLGGHVLDLAGNEGTNKQHQEIFRYFDIFAGLCNDYIDVSSPKLSREEIDLLQKINSGESKTIEFKETLSLDVRKKKDKSYQPIKENYIELAVLKTIVGFLNSDGGELFIGVNDNSEIIGITNELNQFHKSSRDKMLLHLKNLIKSNISSSLSNLCDFKIQKINNEEIIYVRCSKSDKEVYIKGKDFYVRTGPSTDKLEGKDLVEYTKTRF